jgi:hypothetical protein
MDGRGRIVLLIEKREVTLLPSEEREEKEECTVGAGGVCWQRECAFLFQVLLKPTLPHGRADPGYSHPIMNKWGRAWVAPSQVRVVWAISRHPPCAPNFSSF